MAWTKEHRTEYMKKYREEHREQLKANRKYWYQHNKEKNNAYSRKHYQMHKDDPEYKAKRAAVQRQWYANNREKWNAYLRERYWKERLEKACTTSSDCSTCEYCYHDNGYNECAVDGVKPLERREHERDFI